MVTLLTFFRRTDRFLVRPVVKNPPHHVGVRLNRDVFEKVSTDTLYSTVRCLCDDRWLIEKNAPARRMGVEDAGQLRADSAADVGDDRETAPIERRSHGRTDRGAQVAHRLVEDRLRLRVRLQVFPRALAGHLIEARTPVLQRQHQPSPSFEYRGARTERESNPRPVRSCQITAETFARGCVAEYAWRGLREDSCALQRPQHPIQARRVCFRTFGKNVDVQRTISQQIGNFELRGSTDAATLPMVVDDTENLLLRASEGSSSISSLHLFVAGDGWRSCAVRCRASVIRQPGDTSMQISTRRACVELEEYR